MKGIVDGRRYDTKSAVLIGEASHGYGGDFSAWEAGLYKTPVSGAYFLAGRGGPKTRWAQRLSRNEYSSGSGIIPLTLEEALEWAEQNLSVDEVETGFAGVVEDA